MENRINVGALEPEAYKAFVGLENYLTTTKISKTHKELIKIRASQLNGCAYCINMHTKDALKNGETTQRIFLLNAWREVKDLYTLEDRAILAITEEMTLIANNGLSTQTYNAAKELFDDNHLAQIMVAVMTINAWNRMAIATHMQPAYILYHVKFKHAFKDAMFKFLTMAGILKRFHLLAIHPQG